MSEVTLRFDSGVRVGAEVYHLSNGGLGDQNPGENSLVLTVAVPLSRSSSASGVRARSAAP
jgi:lipid A 3-O-deacylase